MGPIVGGFVGTQEGLAHGGRAGRLDPYPGVPGLALNFRERQVGAAAPDVPPAHDHLGVEEVDGLLSPFPGQGAEEDIHQFLAWKIV
jgi:hypothetical protein